MTEIVEKDRLAALERDLAEIKRATGPQPVAMNWTDFKELLSAQNELAREQRRQEKARQDAELAARLRREAPARRRREQEVAALERQIAELEGSAAVFREELHLLRASPLDTEDASGDAAKRRKWCG